MIFENIHIIILVNYMNETTLTKYLKRIILFLLLILSIFIIFKIYPFVADFIKMIIKLILPFIISFTIAYILEPVVLLFQKLVKRRFIAVIITLFLFFSLIFLFFYFSIPLLIEEVSQLSNNYEEIIESIKNALNNFSLKFKFLPEDYQPTFDNIGNMLSNYIGKIDLNNIIDGLINSIGMIIIIPMTTIYLMLDYNNIIEKFKNYLICKKYLKFKSYLSELNQHFKMFVKTTFIIMIIMFTISTIVLFFANSDYPLFFGLIIAITNIIPYLGPYIGGAFPVLYAFSESYTHALIMLVIVVVIQLVESNIITPYIQGKKNDIHPVVVIFSLIIFGKLFGIIGMIIAVPLFNVVKVTFKYYPIRLKIKN